MIYALVWDWLALFLRWFHFTLGITWIGASFYFVWLNNTVRAEPAAGEGVAGQLWAIHGGAFYRVSKYAGAPPALPTVLHWFKWEAYLTWISGALLLALLYWAQARTYMVDPAVADIHPLAAVAIGVSSLVLGWLAYHLLCKSPLSKYPGALGAAILALVAVAAFALTNTLSSHAAFLHVGAMIGTIMAANVFFVIIPGQQAMVSAMIAKQPPPVERGAEGAMRSLHNNYLTLPVLFSMVSSHFPFVTGHRFGWIAMLVLFVIGAVIRHHLNLVERDKPKIWLAPAALATFLALAVAMQPWGSGSAVAASADAVPFTEVHMIVSQRCLPCHSKQPILANLTSPPKDLLLETPDEIVRAAQKIKAQSVDTKIMPLGNLTGMTDEERARIGAWIAAGAMR